MSRNPAPGAGLRTKKRRGWDSSPRADLQRPTVWRPGTAKRSGSRLRKRKGAALRVPADRPALAGVNDRAAVLADLPKGNRQVGDREIGERGAVARAGATLVEAEAEAVALKFPAGTRLSCPRLQPCPEHRGPEAKGAAGVIGGELDQRRGHRGSMGDAERGCGGGAWPAASRWVASVPCEAR